MARRRRGMTRMCRRGKRATPTPGPPTRRRVKSRRTTSSSRPSPSSLESIAQRWSTAGTEDPRDAPGSESPSGRWRVPGKGPREEASIPRLGLIKAEAEAPPLPAEPPADEPKAAEASAPVDAAEESAPDSSMTLEATAESEERPADEAVQPCGDETSPGGHGAADAPSSPPAAAVADEAGPSGSDAEAQKAAGHDAAQGGTVLDEAAAEQPVVVYESSSVVPSSPALPEASDAAPAPRAESDAAAPPAGVDEAAAALAVVPTAEASRAEYADQSTAPPAAMMASDAAGLEKDATCAASKANALAAAPKECAAPGEDRASANRTAPGASAADCLERLDFKDFKERMLAKTRAKASSVDVAVGGVGAQSAQFESIFKTLMDKIKAYEIHQSITELYFHHLQQCYSATLARQDARAAADSAALRADMLRATDAVARTDDAAARTDDAGAAASDAPQAESESRPPATPAADALEPAQAAPERPVAVRHTERHAERHVEMHYAGLQDAGEAPAAWNAYAAPAYPVPPPAAYPVPPPAAAAPEPGAAPPRRQIVLSIDDTFAFAAAAAAAVLAAVAAVLAAVVVVGCALRAQVSGVRAALEEHNDERRAHHFDSLANQDGALRRLGDLAKANDDGKRWPENAPKKNETPRTSRAHTAT
ncbi:hypothetical protein M885DRAFT_316674 [Pelagophyceae sp. CCMP2097]|nr:hypothetical protein M885DRAFT_316674 [Pelagophyceae sp. CCMP2097]